MGIIDRIKKGKVYIVGIGPGNKKYILPEAIEVMENSEVTVGFKRAMESIDHISANKKQVDNLKEIVTYIKDNEDKVISIMASGDPCFYGITEYISRNYVGDVEVVPGISSFQYLFAKLKKSWQGATLGSLHGREEDFIKIVKDNKLSFWLTDKTNTPNVVAAKLLKEGIEGVMNVGENLSYEDERITTADLKEIVNIEFSELSVIIIEKKECD